MSEEQKQPKGEQQADRSLIGSGALQMLADAAASGAAGGVAGAVAGQVTSKIMNRPPKAEAEQSKIVLPPGVDRD